MPTNQCWWSTPMLPDGDSVSRRRKPVLLDGDVSSTPSPLPTVNNSCLDCEAKRWPTYCCCRSGRLSATPSRRWPTDRARISGSVDSSPTIEPAEKGRSEQNRPTSVVIATSSQPFGARRKIRRRSVRYVWSSCRAFSSFTPTRSFGSAKCRSWVTNVRKSLYEFGNQTLPPSGAKREMISAGSVRNSLNSANACSNCCRWNNWKAYIVPIR